LFVTDEISSAEAHFVVLKSLDLEQIEFLHLIHEIKPF